MTVQEQILQLLERLQREQELTYFFISHDLNVVRRICDRIGVLYNGRLVESGDAEQLYREPWHPYTKELMLSTLTADPKKCSRTDVRRRYRQWGGKRLSLCGQVWICDGVL